MRPLASLPLLFAGSLSQIFRYLPLFCSSLLSSLFYFTVNFYLSFQQRLEGGGEEQNHHPAKLTVPRSHKWRMVIAYDGTKFSGPSPNPHLRNPLKFTENFLGLSKFWIERRVFRMHSLKMKFCWELKNILHLFLLKKAKFWL